MMRFPARVRLLVVALATLQGCYNYIPVETAPPVGEDVALGVSDRGRVSLAERFGPGLAEIQGRLVGLQDSNFIINVYRVSHLTGSSALWAGEQSRINRDLVGSIRIRRLSVVRTAALTVATGVALAVFTSRSLSGGGSEQPPADSGKTPISIRIPLHP